MNARPSIGELIASGRLVTVVIVPEPWHGTYAGYTHHGCRCTPCTNANSDQQHARRERAA